MNKMKMSALGVALKERTKKLFRREKTVWRICFAEDRKMSFIPAYWVLTAVMVLIALFFVVYEGRTISSGVNYDSYDSEDYYVTDEWINVLTENKTAKEKALENSNMTETSRETLRAEVADMDKQIRMMSYLKEKNIVLKKSAVGSYEGEEVYYVQGYAYRFDNIQILMPALSSDENDGNIEYSRVSILSDERAGGGAFDANIVFYFVAVLLVVICFSDEFSHGTIKLVVSRPVSRADIGRAKVLSIFQMLTLSWAISAAVYALFSLTVKNPVQYAVFGGGNIGFISFTAYNILVFVDLLLASYGFVALSMFFAVRFKHNIVAIVLPFALYFFKTLIVRVAKNLSYLDFFENLRLMEHLVMGNATYGNTKLWLAVLLSVGIMLLLIVLGINRFKKYDMEKLK